MPSYDCIVMNSVVQNPKFENYWGAGTQSIKYKKWAKQKVGYPNITKPTL